MFAVGQTNNGRERCFVTDTTLTLYCRVAYEMDSFRENIPRVILEISSIKVQFTRCFVIRYEIHQFMFSNSGFYWRQIVSLFKIRTSVLMWILNKTAVLFLHCWSCCSLQQWKLQMFLVMRTTAYFYSLLLKVWQ